MTTQLEFPPVPMTRERAQAAKRGAIAAQACADAADRRDPHWSKMAYGAFVAYARIHAGQQFTTEDVRLAAAKSVPPPPDGRAWGAIAMRAKREEIVKAVGTRCVASSNNSPKTLWQSIILP